MSSDNEIYSLLRRLDELEDEIEDEDGVIEEIEDSSYEVAVRRVNGAIQRRFDYLNRRREAIIQRSNIWDNIFRLMRRGGHLPETESQGNFNSTQNAGGYLDELGRRAILENLAENDNFERRATPTAKFVVDELKFKKIECENEVFFCAICQDLVNVGEVVKELPCMHNYHAECIQSWLASRNTCPICRFKLPTCDHDQERHE